MQKISICHLVNQFDVGGMEKGLVKIINNGSMGAEHYIIALNGHGKLLNTLSKYAPYYYLNTEKHNNRLIIFSLSKLLSRIQPDILHIHSWGPLFDGVTAAYFARIKKTIFSYHGKTYDLLSFNFKNYIKNYVHRLSFLYLSAIITLNNAMKNELIHEFGAPPHKINVIANGTHIYSEVELQKLKTSISNIFLTNMRKFECNIGWVGRLDKIKNLSVVFHALKILKDQKINCRLFVIGDGPELKNFRQCSKEMGTSDQVVFMGYRNDVHKLLAGTDIYVQSSWYEGFSNTILEAMSVGCPVIASGIGGNQELVQEKETGYLFEPSNPEELAYKIKFMLENPYLREILSSNAKKMIKTKFSDVVMARNYEQFYRQLFNK